MTEVFEPVFPNSGLSYEHFGNHEHYRGLSVRDYMAIHSVTPGAMELAAAAGYSYHQGAVWESPDKRIDSFEGWWNKLDQTTRFRLFAQVKYQMADAMISERDKHD